jgi:hypothetical protein
MIPAKIYFENKFGFSCEVHGSYIENGCWCDIYSFEGNYMYRVHKNKIESIEILNLNK